MVLTPNDNKSLSTDSVPNPRGNRTTCTHVTNTLSKNAVHELRLTARRSLLSRVRSVLSEPSVGCMDAGLKRYTGPPPKTMQPRNVEQLSRGAIGL
jgi:hypothetical protein